MRQFASAEGTLFRLRAGGVECDEDGPRIAGVALLRREARPGGPPRWRLPPLDEIESSLARACGCEIGAAGKIGGLRVVADALNKGEVARAQIASLLMRLPDPPPPGADAALRSELDKRLGDSGLLKDWNPDAHPRTGVAPNPGWFAPKDGDARSVESRPNATAPDTPPGGPATEVISICIAEGISIATDEYGNKLSSCDYVCHGGGSFHRDYLGDKGCPLLLRPNFLN